MSLARTTYMLSLLLVAPSLGSVKEPPTPVVVEKPTPVTEGCPDTDYMNSCRMTSRGGNKECVVLDGVCQKMTISEDGCPDIAHFMDLHAKYQFIWIDIKNICMDFDGCEMWNNFDRDCDDTDPGCELEACAKEDPFIPPAPVTETPPVTEGCPDTDDDLDCRMTSRGGNKECVVMHDVCQRMTMSEDGCPDIAMFMDGGRLIDHSWATMNTICNDFDGCEIWNNPNCDLLDPQDCNPAACSRVNPYTPPVKAEPTEVKAEPTEVKADPTEQPTPEPTIQPTEAYTSVQGICTDSDDVLGRTPPPLGFGQASHFDIPLEQCEEMCTSDGACTAFDYGPQKKISDELEDRMQCNIYHERVAGGFVKSKRRSRPSKTKGIAPKIRIRTNYADNTCYINKARFKPEEKVSVKFSFGAIVVIPVVIVGCLVVGALWIRTRRKKAAKAQENVDSGVVHTNAQENMV